MNIYTFGNIEEMKKFIKKEIDKEFDIKTDVPFFDGKYHNYNWYFRFYFQELNKELIDKISAQIIDEHKNKNIKHNNNIILIFLDISKEKDKIQMIFDTFEKINVIYRPQLVFAIKSKKEDEETNEKEENKEMLEILFKKEMKSKKNLIKKYIEIVYYRKNDYYELIKTIRSIFCYFNNISDIFSILDEMIRGYKYFHPSRNNSMKYISTFNILVVGRPGSGKSTLINLLLNKRKAREGIGTSITKIVSKYVHDKYPITFEDTPGFEDNDDLKKMITFLKESNQLFKQGKNKFHLVLYLINGSNERTFIGNEVSLIDFIQKEMKIPIFFVCTKSKNEEYAKDFEEVIKLNLWKNFGDKTELVNYIYCCHLLNEKDGVYKRFGIDNLLNSIKKYYEEEINKWENNLKNKSFENDIITKNGLSYNPIFFADLKNYDDFEDYLEKMSEDIIENYEYLAIKEIKKNVLIKNNEYQMNIQKINEMLVDHLALELDGKSSGKIFCEKNCQEVENNVNTNIMEDNGFSLFCLKSTHSLVVKDECIKERENIKMIKITKEFGTLAKKQFLNELKRENNIKNYLNKIIDNYKYAIESLPNLNDEIDN